jgi:hypothetical protein
LSFLGPVVAGACLCQEMSASKPKFLFSLARSETEVTVHLVTNHDDPNELVTVTFSERTGLHPAMVAELLETERRLAEQRALRAAQSESDCDELEGFLL